jgi:hypothetical protein
MLSNKTPLSTLSRRAYDGIVGANPTHGMDVFALISIPGVEPHLRKIQYLRMNCDSELARFLIRESRSRP